MTQWSSFIAIAYWQDKPSNFELEQFEKYENYSSGYEKVILETRLFSVFVNTWCPESIVFCKQIDFVK